MRKFENIHWQREKQWRKLKKEDDRLWDARQLLGEYPLNKPIRDGWYKYLVLRDDIARRTDAWIYEEALNATRYWAWGRTKSQLEKVWKNGQKRPRQLVRKTKFPGVRDITKHAYERLHPRVQKLFIPVMDSCQRWIIAYRCTVPYHNYRPKYERAYITHQKVISPDIQSRMQEIDEVLERREEFIRIEKGSYGTSSWDRFEKLYTSRRHRRKLHMSLSRLLQEDAWVELPALYEQPKKSMW